MRQANIDNLRPQRLSDQRQHPRGRPHRRREYLQLSNKYLQLSIIPRTARTNRNHVARISLVLAATQLRQGSKIMVRGRLNKTWQKEKRWRYGLWCCKIGTLTSRQPRLHTQGWSHPQVWPEHLPSMLQREVERYRIHQGTTMWWTDERFS